jgi:E3 ubiquitin-protein ligase TRIP12
VASFASSILSSKEHPSLIIDALQMVDFLLAKVPALYKPAFRREGVFHEVEVLAERPITSAKSKDKESPEASASKSGSVPPAPRSLPSGASIPGFKKFTSLSLEPEDAITLRARVIQFKHLSKISASNATEKELSEALRELAELLHRPIPLSQVSSFCKAVLWMGCYNLLLNKIEFVKFLIVNLSVHADGVYLNM